MPASERIPLPHGLPAHLSFGDDGYHALCVLLGVTNRDRKQALANASFVKQHLRTTGKAPPRQARASDRARHSLLALYSDPDARRVMWRNFRDHQDPPNKSSRPFPSLEHVVLSQCDASLLTMAPDQERLADLVAFYVPEQTDDDWRVAALAALPRMKDEFEAWASLSAQRRAKTIKAAFATATLLDDARLLLWASDLEDEIAKEYAFLKGANVLDDGLLTSGEDDAEKPAVDSVERYFERFRAHALALRDAAQALADGPVTSALFKDLADSYTVVFELKEPVLERSDAELVRKILSDFASLLDKEATAIAWLAEETEPVLAKWREVYQKSEGTRPDRLREDIERAIAALPGALDLAAAAQSDAEQAMEAHDRHETEIAAKDVASRTDRTRQVTLSESLSKSRKAVVDAMDGVLAVLMPCANANPRTENWTGKDAAPTVADEVEEPPTSEVLSGRKDELKAPTLDSSGHSDSVSKPAEHPTIQAECPSADKPPAAAPSQQTEVSIEASVPPGDSRSPEKSPPASESPPADDNGRQSEGEQGGEAPPKLIAATDASPPASVQDGIWHAIGNGRLGIAYHIARLSQAIGQSANPSPELLAAVCLGTILRGPDDSLAAAYGRRVGVLGGLDFGETEPPMRDALNLLLFAATLRPAVFAAQHGASIPLLRRVRLSGEFTPIHRLAAAVAKTADKLKTVRLDIPTLSAILDEGVWNDRFAAHRESVAQWHEGARAATFLFAAASSVWQHWLGSSGLLAELTRLLSAERPTQVERVQEIADQLDDRKAVHSLIEDTYRNTIGRHGESIVGRALTQLESRLETPSKLARDWLRIVQARPGGAGYLKTTVEKLRKVFDQHAPPAIEMIAQSRQADSVPTFLASALACAAQVIESLANLFWSNADAQSEIALGPTQALSDDLLYVTNLTIVEEGQIDDSMAPADALAFMIDTKSHAETLTEAFDARLGQGDLLGAHAVCARMAVEDDDDTDSSRDQLNRALAESRSVFQRQLYNLAERLEQAFIIGEVSEPQRAELTASIDDVSQRLEERNGALTAGVDINAIAAALEPACERGVARISAQLDAYLPRIKAHEQSLIGDAIRSGDLATLYEQLDCLKREQSLLSPDAGIRSRLRSFIDAANSIEDELNGETGPAQSAIESAVSQRQDIFGLPFSRLSPAQAKRAAKLIELWYEIGRHRSPDPEFVAGFFGALGFTVTPGAVEPRGDATAKLRTEPLRARELCPTHAFGSDADGRYDLVFNRSALAREPIIQAIATADPNAHTIVLHFGKLSGVDRDWLRRWSIEHPTQFITVDETLVLYLASLQEGRLRALFECTLPFTCTEPYFTAPGLVPPEAFFGRERERREVIDRYGSCFVYGGRQLGKTALLHSAEAVFHDPSGRRLAKYLDLKYEDIGYAYDADHIWQVLWHEFLRLDVVDHEVPMPRGRKGLIDALAKTIKAWLDAHKDGRILLLLDEADAFLSKDLERDFRVSTQLKGLMEKTERRFKVVLCGLHNVLRNTERANHPLAHFGEPLCVGPLLANGGLEQARALIREPMAAVGYEFETDNLITKILFWTNYYPSLIQLFGQTLLRYLRLSPERGFPRTITDDDIQAVFSRHQFRDYIRNRFSLTLQLDQRYEVIAYAMAFDLQGAFDRLAEGLSNNRIFELVREYWREGFDISKREFGTLLREMCGLGVLRQRTDGKLPGRYVFRNPNVLRLLGDADTILDVLYKVRELPVTFEASAFHAQFDRPKAGSPRRGPLTYEQETELNRGGRVAVLSGSRATNFADVDKFLSERAGQSRLRPLKPSMDANTLVREVKRLRPDRDNYICLVDVNEPWTLLWLERVADAIREVQRGRQLRVVFRANPGQLWRFVSELPDEYLHADNSLFDWFAAQPWNAAFLRHWCSDLGLHDAGARIAELLELTGGWPMLLERYAASEEQSWKARSAELEQYIADHKDDLLDAVGLGTPASRLEIAPLLAWERLTTDEVETYADLWKDEGRPPVSAHVLLRRLCWAGQIGIVQEVDGGSVLNPLIKRILPANVA